MSTSLLETPDMPPPPPINLVMHNCAYHRREVGYPRPIMPTGTTTTTQHHNHHSKLTNITATFFSTRFFPCICKNKTCNRDIGLDAPSLPFGMWRAAEKLLFCPYTTPNSQKPRHAVCQNVTTSPRQQENPVEFDEFRRDYTAVIINVRE